MQVVVGVAIIDQGRVLAARRSAPPELAGRWELPGGKVDPGETPARAAVREIVEELGCVVELDGVLPGSVPIGDGSPHGATLVLEVVTAHLVEGDPVPLEHDAVRWLRGSELGEVVWADADVPFLEPLSDLVGSGGPG